MDDLALNRTFNVLRPFILGAIAYKEDGAEDYERK